MTGDEVNMTYLSKAEAMFEQLDGQPCVNVDANAGHVHVCNRIYDLLIADEVVEGMCDWKDSFDRRPDELTDGMAIGSDLLDVGNDWWLDMYFNWYFVFTPRFVKLSILGDDSWVTEFLHTVIRNRTIPRPPPFADTTHLLPNLEALKYFG